ncbi:nucleoside diphosphate kinase regulator [Amaricoccus sp.]|uniref:nucleoside diphosphate kinase regulator n=1 Tax=Amaricoccus sp. TaxID=1872485 RepID=UPI001B3EDF17|nr:nucleoside diphosphate kinase regulator [Amaricoccus sp.]MBP7002228.1 nucleoside diphosphate kinase regulator [Amaricoccus sp.]
MPTRPASDAPRAPDIVLDATQADRLAAAAEGALRQLPEVAGRLLDEIARARVVAPGELPANVVGLGREATYRDEATGRETSVVLVMPPEADIANARVSVLTPIGVALIGLSAGASFDWRTRNGETRRLTVTRVA